MHLVQSKKITGSPAAASSLDLAPPKSWRRCVPFWLRSLIWIDSAQKYDAFLSYSWKTDGNIAPVIQSVIQRFLCPWYRFRAKTVFRDLSCLPAGSSLEAELFNRLDRSDHLIVLASPEAAVSRGMEIEARHWFSCSRDGQVLLVVTSGDCETWQEIRDHLLPPAIKANLTSEPLWIRLQHRRNEILANPNGHQLRGELTEDLKQLLLRFYPNRDWGQLRGEERSQRRRVMALLWGIALGFLALALVAFGFANTSRDRLYDVERLSYFHRIELAERYRLDGQLARSDEILGQCDPKYECGWEWHYLKRVLHSELGSFTHGSEISQINILARSGSEPEVVSVGRDGTIRLWNLQGDVRSDRLSASNYRVEALAVSKNGRVAAVSQNHGVLLIRDGFQELRDGFQERVICENCGSFGPVLPGGALALTADGGRVAVIDGSKVKVWNIKNNQKFPLSIPPARYRKLEFLPDGNSIITLTRSPNFADDGRIGTIEVWPLGSAVADHTQFRNRDVNDFTVNPAGDVIAVATELGPILYELGSRKTTILPAGQRPAKAVAFAPDGQRLAVGGAGGEVTVWNISTAQALSSLQVAEGSIVHLKFADDGRTLVVASGDTIKIWDATSDQTSITYRPSTYDNAEVVSPAGERESFGGLSDIVPNILPLISSDGKFAAAARETIVVRSVRNGREIFRTDFEIKRWRKVRTLR